MRTAGPDLRGSGSFMFGKIASLVACAALAVAVPVAAEAKRDGHHKKDGGQPASAPSVATPQMASQRRGGNRARQARDHGRRGGDNPAKPTSDPKPGKARQTLASDGPTKRA